MPLWNPPHPLQTINFSLLKSTLSLCLPPSLSHSSSISPYLSFSPSLCLPVSLHRCAALNVSAKSCWHHVCDVCVPVTKLILPADFLLLNHTENVLLCEFILWHWCGNSLTAKKVRYLHMGTFRAIIILKITTFLPAQNIISLICSDWENWESEDFLETEKSD